MSPPRAAEETLDEGPSPIAPEPKELLWGFGAFIVFLILMRLWLVPKVKRGMEARYGSIRGEHESADADPRRRPRATSPSTRRRWRACAPRPPSGSTPLAPSSRPYAAARLAEVNAAIAARRAAAAAEADAAHQAASGQIEEAVADVAARAAELTVGRVPDSDSVRQAVSTVMAAPVAGGGA